MSSDFVFAPGSNEIALALEKLPEGAFKYFAAVFEVSISHVEIQRGIKKRTDSRVYLATFATRLIRLLFVVTGGLTFHRGVVDFYTPRMRHRQTKNRFHSKSLIVVFFMVKSLSHALACSKWTGVVFCGFPWASLGKDVLAQPTVTPRGKSSEN